MAGKKTAKDRVAKPSQRKPLPEPSKKKAKKESNSSHERTAPAKCAETRLRDLERGQSELRQGYSLLDDGQTILARGLELLNNALSKLENTVGRLKGQLKVPKPTPVIVHDSADEESGEQEPRYVIVCVNENKDLALPRRLYWRDKSATSRLKILLEGWQREWTTEVKYAFTFSTAEAARRRLHAEGHNTASPVIAPKPYAGCPKIEEIYPE